MAPPTTPPSTVFATTSDTTKVARPYLKLLMAVPPADQENNAEEHKLNCRFYLHVLSRGVKNKDWRSVSVFPDDDEDFDEPLTPLPSQQRFEEQSHEDKTAGCDGNSDSDSSSNDQKVE